MSAQAKPKRIKWYRTPVDRDVLKQLNRRSNALGFAQAFGYLGTYALTAGLGIYAAIAWPWWAVVGLVFLHGMVGSFMINGVHELGHNTVFRTKSLNNFFEHVLAFLGWINCEMFKASHARHHAYTLHPPDDLEVVLPIRLMVKHFFMQGFVNVMGLKHAIRNTWRIARGRLQGEWELTLFPEDSPKRAKPVNWARTLLIGHGVIVVGSVVLGFAHSPVWWLVPVLVTFGPFIGNWLFFLCNNTQHIGLQDNVADFRLCCRTFLLNPVFQFLYWHMNYHTEHHMYPTVPCYRLGKLHRLIRHDLPPCPRGLVTTWREIAAIQARQEQDPDYQHAPPVANAGA